LTGFPVLYFNDLIARLLRRFMRIGLGDVFYNGDKCMGNSSGCFYSEMNNWRHYFPGIAMLMLYLRAMFAYPFYIVGCHKFSFNSIPDIISYKSLVLFLRRQYIYKTLNISTLQNISFYFIHLYSLNRANKWKYKTTLAG
jgi:hypothetical protein